MKKQMVNETKIKNWNVSGWWKNVILFADIIILIENNNKTSNATWKN
jgi:hypothetical protein